MGNASATDAEKAALKRIASLRARLVGLLLACMAVILLATQLRIGDAAVILAGGALLVMASLAVYVSCGLRCPRCASWIPLPSPRSRCTSCGLGLEAGSGKESRTGLLLGALLVIQAAPMPGNAAEVAGGRIHVKKDDCSIDGCRTRWSVKDATDVYSEPDTLSTRMAVLEPSTLVTTMGGETHLIPGEARIIARPYRTALDLDPGELVYVLEYEGDGRSRIYQEGKFYVSKIARTNARCEVAGEPDPRYCWVEVLREPAIKARWLKVDLPGGAGTGWVLGGQGNLIRFEQGGG